MIKVTELRNTDGDDNSFFISAFADTKAEVSTEEFVGLPKNAKIEMGSTVMTAAGEIAFMKSDGQWNWV